MHYSPIQLCTFQMDRGALLLNSNHLKRANIELDLVNSDLNLNYDQMKGLYKPPLDITIDPLLDQLLTAMYYR
jgi:hypothetical protein